MAGRLFHCAILTRTPTVNCPAAFNKRYCIPRRDFGYDIRPCGGSNPLQHPEIVLWVMAIFLDIALIALAIWRKRQSSMPYFFAFVLCLGVRDIMLFAVYHITAPRYMPYFYAYWVSDIVIVLLRFLVLREICLDALHQSPGMLESASKAFKWTAGLLVLAAFVSGAVVDGSAPSQMMATIQVFRRSVLLFEAGLLLMLLLVAFHFGLRWNRFTFGVAFGLTLYAALQLPLAALAAEYGRLVQNVASVLNAGAYIIALLVWIGFCALPREEEGDVPFSATGAIVPQGGVGLSETVFGTNLKILELLRR